MSDHEEMESSIAAMVLGALEDDEVESVRLHVEGCPSCQQAVARLRRAAAALPLEVEEVTPPARLRERIYVAAAAARASTLPSAPARKRVPTAAPRWKAATSLQLNRLFAFAVAATVLLALLIGLVAGDLLGRGSVTPPPAQVARFSLVGHGALAAVRGTVIDLKTDGVTLVDFHGLPALDKGKVYEVWLITPGGHPDSAAVFVPDSNGGKVVLVNLPLKGYAQMAVTAEDGPDGAIAPTQQPQIYGTLA
jgi:anti-sigma-K factor RskA